MADELSARERQMTVTGMLAQYRAQLFRARVDLAANVGNTEGVAELQKVVAQLCRGIANVETEFAADLAHVEPAAEKEGPYADR